MAENLIQQSRKSINKSHTDRSERAKEKIKESFLASILYMRNEKGELVENPTVTDISFNGTELYVQDNEHGRYKVDSEQDPRIKRGERPLKVTAEHVRNLGNDVQNVMGVQWNNNEPILDVELGELRTNFMNITVSPYGETFALRVSRPSLAIKNIADMCDPDTAKLLEVFMRCGMNLLISGQTGSGKALTVDTVIPTPKGDKRMGDIQVGDYVYDRKGEPTLVTGVFPQGILEAYEVVLSDGRKVICNDEHLWTYVTDKGIYKTVTLREMLEEGIYVKGVKPHAKYYIPMSSAVVKEEKELPMHPYVLGALLGDGCLRDETLTVSSEDDWIPNKIASIICAKGLYKNNSNHNYQFELPDNHGYEVLRKHTKFFKTRMVLPEYMRSLAGDKHIPNIFLEGSIEQRYELLQGLMDTDGSITRGGTRYNVSFVTTSEQLAKDITQLLRSLGYKSSIRSNKRSENTSTEYTVFINVPNEEKQKLFTLPRKWEIAKEAENYKKKARYDRIGIVEVNKLPTMEEMVCIMVDNEEHLFLANDYVVTHNTEFQKALIGYIPDERKISLMEDTLDSHIKKIYPHKDINSWATSGEKGEDNYIGFPELIRSGLRNNPDWLMISEVRGAEAQDLLSAALTGHSIMTTLHATGADNIPSRLSNMVAMSGNSNYEALQLDIVSVLNLGMHLHRKVDPVSGRISREVREIYEYTSFKKGQGIIGRPIYEIRQNYDPTTDTYSETRIKKRLSERLLTIITNNREIHNVPSVYKDGEYDD